MLPKIKSFCYFSFFDCLDVVKETYFPFFRSEKSNNFYTRQLIEYLLRQECSLQDSNRTFILKDFQSTNFLIRKDSSDSRVFKQIWLDKEYLPAMKYLSDLSIQTIVDCGANVGYSAVFFSRQFPEARIFCIEPDKNNIKILHENLSINKLTQVTPINKGIWHHQALLKITHTFRDGKDWSISLEETLHENEVDVEAISISEIMNQYQLPEIDFLKIDIEGAERYIFQDFKTANKFLARTKSIAIEIHDEFNIRSAIYEILAKAGFRWIESGELTIARKV